MPSSEYSGVDQQPDRQLTGKSVQQEAKHVRSNSRRQEAYVCLLASCCCTYSSKPRASVRLTFSLLKSNSAHPRWSKLAKRRRSKMSSKVRLLERLVASRQISCLHKNAVSSAFQETNFQPASRIKRLQGCHFHFQSRSTSSSQEPLIHNHSLISSWQTRFFNITFYIS